MCMHTYVRLWYVFMRRSEERKQEGRQAHLEKNKKKQRNHEASGEKELVRVFLLVCEFYIAGRYMWYSRDHAGLLHSLWPCLSVFSLFFLGGGGGGPSSFFSRFLHTEFSPCFPQKKLPQ